MFGKFYSTIMASAGQSVAASFTAFWKLAGTSGLMTSAASFPILKTWGTASVHRPQAVQRIRVDSYLHGRSFRC